MTLAALRNTQRIDSTAVPSVYEFPAAVDIIYAGAMVCLNSSGYAEPAGASAGQTAVIGRCERTVDNSGGTAGDLNVEVSPGQFKYTNSGSSATITSIGKLCYAVDDESVHTSNAGGRPIAGMITRVDSDGVVFQSLFHIAAGFAAAVAAGQALPRLYYVRGASTANVANLAAFTVANDGITFLENELVLLKNQAAPAENGIYVVGTVAAGAAPLTRAADFDGLNEVVSGVLVHISEGTVNADDWYTLTTNAAITVGTTALTFTKLPSLADLASTAAGDGAALVGIQDVGTYYAAANVEAALQELGATTGAAIIGVADAGGYFTGANVEACLAEVGAFKIIKRSATITSADLTTAGVGPESESIGAVLPNTAVVVAYRANLTDAFDNGAGVSLVMEIGHSNDVDAYEDGIDVFTASTAEGAGWIYTTTGPGLGAPAWDGTAVGQCVATFTSGADQLANYTNGSVTVEIIAIDVAP